MWIDRRYGGRMNLTSRAAMLAHPEIANDKNFGAYSIHHSGQPARAP
jgi:hypothetical protein